MNEEFSKNSIIIEFACKCIIVREIILEQIPEQYTMQLSLYYCSNHTIIKKMMYKGGKNGTKI